MYYPCFNAEVFKLSRLEVRLHIVPQTGPETQCVIPRILTRFDVSPLLFDDTM